MHRIALTLTVALALSTTLGAATEFASNSLVSSAFPELLNRHQRVMQPLADSFSDNPVRLDYLEGDEDTGERISFVWQNGKYRKEFRWVGFTEVFGYDGTAQWHGSDYNLPRILEKGKSPDLTPQLIGYYEYLKPEWAQYLSPAPVSQPLGIADRFALMEFSPPGMSEALVLIDPIDFRLAGMLIGNSRALSESMLYTITYYEDWADFGPAWYPAVIRIERYSPDGQQLRERRITTQSIQLIDPLPDERFGIGSSLPVMHPALPTIPFEVPFSYLNDTVIIRCLAPDGTRRRLELDTGANVGLVRGDVAEKLGLNLRNYGEITGHGGSARVQYARIEGLRIEGQGRENSVEIPPWPAAVLVEDSRLDDALADKGVDGLLGNFLLHNFVIRINYRRRVIELFPPDVFDPELHLEADYHAVPVVRDIMPYAQVTVDGAITGGAFFNTGAHHFFTLNVWAIDDAGKLYEVDSIGSGITVHGLTDFGIIHPEQVQLSDIIIKSPRTHLEILAPGEAPNRNQIASFGNAFFERYTVTFDLFHEMYYIEGV